LWQRVIHGSATGTTFFSKRTYDWDWAGADASYQRALALEPRNATVVGSAAVLAFTLGRFEEATHWTAGQ
jgi:hypothetical protein